MALGMLWYVRRPSHTKFLTGSEKWIIEDEEVLLLRLQQEAGESKKSFSKDSPASTPVFFR